MMIERKNSTYPTPSLRAMMVAGLLLAISALAACNTVEGAGKDISKAGDKIEDTARDVKKSN